ncbi:Uma2 family endonuclease [Streptomyces sp. ODS28]|uniref:Uma2 family endonuclease n=1 Tax=Streptomyces sp. ODS28 TaxID=3136688 RepID=UPI0031E506BB
MTVMAEPKSQMSVEEFERIASAAPDSVRLEFLNGRIGGKVVPDGDHGTILEWLMHICMQHRPDLSLNWEQGLRVGAYRKGCARPDATLAPKFSFAGQGDWADPTPVLMTVEVTSYDSDTDSRDRKEKPRAYAEAGIPVYLLIDRDSCEVVVHSEPDGPRYKRIVRVLFGEDAELPDPVGITLTTEILKNWVS